MALYFEVFPDGRTRQRWPGIVYVRVRPTWMRYSGFNQSPALIVEFDAKELSGAAVLDATADIRCSRWSRAATCLQVAPLLAPWRLSAGVRPT